jgi:hypothetical protein
MKSIKPAVSAAAELQAQVVKTKADARFAIDQAAIDLTAPRWSSPLKN